MRGSEVFCEEVASSICQADKFLNNDSNHQPSHVETQDIIKSTKTGSCRTRPGASIG